MINKIINFIKKYKYQILLIILYLLFFIQMQNVGMYADDYYVRASFMEYDKNLINQIYWIYYHGFSGRLIGQFVIHGGLGYFGMQFFKILNPIFLFMFCYYSSKIINIQHKHNTLQIILFLSLIIMGLDSSIVKECLYWADGTILYLWGYIPLMAMIYFILDCCINNKQLSTLRFILSIIFIIIINFTMESTAILGITFLLLVLLNNFIEKNHNKKILFLFLFSAIVLIGVYFIPGNQSRMLNYEEPFASLTFIGRFIYKMPDYFGDLFNGAIFPFLFIMAGIFIYHVFKENYDKIYKIYSIILFVINIILFINYNIYSFINFSNTDILTIIFKIFCLLYLLINICIGFIVSQKKQKYYIYIVIGGILANLISVFFIEYNTMRFCFSLVVVFLIYIFNSYFTGNDNQKMYILILYNLIINCKLGIILIIFYFILSKKNIKQLNYIKYCLLIPLIIFNIINFSKCIYYYYENSKIFEYNENVLKSVSDYLVDEIHLRRLPYPNYAFQMPEDNEYIIPWYKDYYNIKNISIIWDD